VWVGCGLRLVALVMLMAMLLQPAWYAVAGVAAASTLYYLGHFVATLEQELRCARLGASSGAGQTAYRIAEVVAPPLAFALVLAAGRWQDDLPAVVATAMGAVVLHGLMCLRWWRADPAPVPLPTGGPGLRAACAHLRSDRALMRGLLASTLALGVFGWALLATPFALQGRMLLGLALDSAAGTALFKTVAAVVGVAGAMAWGRVLRTDGGAAWVVAGVTGSPLLFAAALTTHSDASAVLLMAVVCAILLGLFSWQRRLRQLRTPPALFPAVTVVCLSIECLGLSLAGLALLARQPWVLGVMAGGTLAALLLPCLQAGGLPDAVVTPPDEVRA